VVNADVLGEACVVEVAAPRAVELSVCRGVSMYTPMAAISCPRVEPMLLDGERGGQIVPLCTVRA